jgi:hypothetical protein
MWFMLPSNIFSLILSNVLNGLIDNKINLVLVIIDILGMIYFVFLGLFLTYFKIGIMLNEEDFLNLKVNNNFFVLLVIKIIG